MLAYLARRWTRVTVGARPVHWGRLSRWQALRENRISILCRKAAKKAVGEADTIVES